MSGIPTQAQEKDAADKIRTSMRNIIATARYIEGTAPKFARLRIGDFNHALFGGIEDDGTQMIHTYGRLNDKLDLADRFIASFGSSGEFEREETDGWIYITFHPNVSGDVKIRIAVSRNDT